MRQHWNIETTDLRERAAVVLRPDLAGGLLSARKAAGVLSGVVSLIARRWGVAEMQRACAELVRHEPAWRTSFGQLPTDTAGFVSEQVLMLAVVARGVLSCAGAENTRSALSFWAAECDPAVWTSVAGA